jgi:hypothetical protein
LLYYIFHFVQKIPIFQHKMPFWKIVKFNISLSSKVRSVQFAN